MGCCASTPQTDFQQAESHSVLSPNEITTTKNGKNSASPRECNTKTTNNQSNEKEKANNKQNDEQDVWDLDASARDTHRKEFQQKMDDKKVQLAEDAKKLADLQDKAFDDQVTRQRGATFAGIYEVFHKYAKLDGGNKMDIDGCTEALAHFGIIINTDRTFQKLVFSKFDIDNEKEIDYNDFMATMSSLIGTKDEDSLLLMFQMFDIDEDGYLNAEDMARILLAQNHIAVVLTGQQGTKGSSSHLKKRHFLKLARKMLTKYESANFNHDKISYDEYAAMMMSLTEQDMIIDNFQLSISISASPTGSKNKKIKQGSPSYTPNQNNLTPQY